MPSDHARRVDHLLEMQSDPAELALCEAEIVMYDLHQTKASGGTYLAVFKDDSYAYHKRHDELNSEQVEAFGHNMNTPPMHECAAWHFAQALGPQYQQLLPVTVYRKIEGKWGSLAAELPGTKPAGGAYAGAPDQVNDAGLFDVLIGQQDRHLHNFVWDANGGRLGLFDHAFAFPAAGHKHRSRSWQLQRSGATRRSSSRARRCSSSSASWPAGVCSASSLSWSPSVPRDEEPAATAARRAASHPQGSVRKVVLSHWLMLV